MKPRGVAGFLAELERQLDGSAARRTQVTAEIAEHLDDLVSEGRALGLDQAAAEARAIERFGSPRRLARGLRRRPRTPRTARIALALATLGLCGGFAYSSCALRRPSSGSPSAATSATQPTRTRSRCSAGNRTSSRSTRSTCASSEAVRPCSPDATSSMNPCRPRWHSSRPTAPGSRSSPTRRSTSTT